MTEESLFELAVNTPAAERAALLDRECAGQPDRRARLEALLAAHFALGPLPGTIHYQPRADAGTVVAGKYKLLQRIGEGGMGTVWMADQTEPVKRRVAVKLIRAERGSSKSILGRFEAERQAIALMDHPHIARLLDAGSTEHGQPFFVMELVKGVPLSEFCDAHKLPIPERLALFQQVCAAVQHAHQKGIIHRDLKPSNLLVESHDGRPVPKVIDFGLAKATSGMQLTEHTLFTAFGSVLGTPRYMAPEQARFNAVDVDTRADIYALGVILYELLTGSTPLTRESVKQAALDEVLRLIREQEAPTPSSRLNTAETQPTIAANRQTEPAKLGRLVKGELDWIVLKALAKERDRRYETASGLARDIERFLNHEPVTAGPPTAAYRLRKFVRRHRPQVLAAGLVLLALVAGMVGTSLGLVEAQQARLAEAERADGERQAKLDAEGRRREAETQKSRAEVGEKLAEERLQQVEAEKKQVEAEKQIAQAVRDFLQHKLLGQADTRTQADALLRSGGKSAEAKLNPTIRELLDRAAEELAADKIEANFPKQALLQAELLQTVGDTYRGVGEAKQAVGFLTRALALRRQHLGAEHPDTLTSMHNLALGYEVAGQLDKALPLFEETLKLFKTKLGADHPDTLTNMNNLATAYQHAGRLDKALPLFEETLKIRKTKQGADHPDTLTSMNNLAEGYRAAGHLDKALPLYEETLKLRKTKQGADHPHTLTSMNNLAEGYRARPGQLDQALPLYEETLKLRKARLGADHPDTLTSMSNLAEGYRHAGRLDKALPLYEETLKLSKAKLGADHPHTLTSMNNLAEGYQAAGQLDQALPLFEETLKIRKTKQGADHPHTLTSMNNLALGYRAAGQLDKALPLFEETLKLSKAKLGADHPNTLHSMNNLAACLWSLKQLQRSIPLLEQTLQFREKKLGRQHPDTQMTVANLGVNYKDARRLAEALPLLEEAYRSSKRLPTLRWVSAPLLDAYQKAGKTKEPLALIAELLAQARATLPKDSPQLAGSLAQHGLSLLQLEAFAEAEPILRECLVIRQKTQPQAWTTFNTQSLLGGALLGQKKYADAEARLPQGYEGMKARKKTIPPQGRIRLPEALDRLVELYTATNRPDEAKQYRAERATYPGITPTRREKK